MMSMIVSRRELYERLWEDYFDRHGRNVAESFIYGYLRQNKDRRAGSVAQTAESLREYSARKKVDKYILLKAAHLAYSEGRLTREEYVEYFGAVASVKNRKTGELKLPKCCELNSDEGITAAQEYQEQKLLKGCVSDFFQNAGFRRDAAGDEENFSRTAVKYEKEKEGYISDLDLWAAYYMYSMQGSAGESGRFIPRLEDEYIGKCAALLRLMNNEEYSDAFVPLYFDSVSGAGVFIIGDRRFEGRPVSGCAVYMICFDGLLENISDMSTLPCAAVITEFDSVEEAFFALRRGIADGSFCASYSAENNEPPVGADSCFDAYFYISEQVLEFREKINARYAERERADFLLELEEERRRRQRMPS